MSDFNGIILSPATIGEECDYCGVDLKNTYSMRLEGKDKLSQKLRIRYICPNCIIEMFDAIAGKKKS